MTDLKSYSFFFFLFVAFKSSLFSFSFKSSSFFVCLSLLNLPHSFCRISFLSYFILPPPQNNVYILYFLHVYPLLIIHTTQASVNLGSLNMILKFSVLKIFATQFFTHMNVNFGDLRETEPMVQPPPSKNLGALCLCN